MASSPHCLVVPFPAQGHISPILQFSKRLIPKGIRITLAFTRFISATITATSATAPDIRIVTISDGYDGGGPAEAENIGVYMDRFRDVGSQTLTRLIQKQSDAGDSLHCVVYDSCLPWCLDVAKGFGLMAAPFFTQSCAVDSIYNHVRDGFTAKNPLPWLPPLDTRDLPSFVTDAEAYPGVLDMFKEQFSNLDKADWVLCNTVYELEQESADWLTKRWPNFITVGPTIPSSYLDERLPNDADYGFSIFKPLNEASMNWLSDKPKGSVVYVSFGSLANLGAEQMEELCHGLKNLDRYFLWVVRESEQVKLLNDFSSTTGEEKGLIVSWCPQLQVLASGAVGCFLTHCGWNSTLEALSLGVAMVAMPRWSDQTTNAKFIEDVWGVGVRADEGGGDGNGVVMRREEIERCVREVVMEGERGEEIRKNGDKWKNVMKDALTEGGSSDRNVSQFAASLIQL